MYSGTPNDSVIDIEEAELLTSLVRDSIYDKSLWGKYIDDIIKHSKSDNMDQIAKNVYRMNLPEEYYSDGYMLAKALAQASDSDDSDADKLVQAYHVILQYADKSDYKTIVSKLAIKLMSGKKIDTIAMELELDRETIRDELALLTEIGGED